MRSPATCRLNSRLSALGLHLADLGFHTQSRHLGDATINKLTHLNAMREFSYDPFALFGLENCTVGALRAQVTHVNIEPARRMGGAAPERDPNKPVTSGDINRMFAEADAATAL